MRICSRCKTEKSLEEFPFKNRSKGTRHYACIPCHRELVRSSYNRNPQGQIDRANKRQRAFIEAFYNWKSTLKCSVCSENATECLDFHHMDPTQKDFQIGSNIHATSLDQLKKELEKCVALCSNCHRKVHAGRIVCPDMRVDTGGLAFKYIR